MFLMVLWGFYMFFLCFASLLAFFCLFWALYGIFPGFV